MDIEVIKALSDLPVMGLLIFFLVRQQQQVDKLTAQLAIAYSENTKAVLAAITAGFCPVVSRETRGPIRTSDN